MSCTQCGEISKYKCPTCRQPYCSVVCCKKHKEIPCSAPPPPIVNEAETTEATYDYPTEDTVPVDMLKLLDNSVELKKCLENPHVRQILQQLDKATHPEELLQEFMLDPIFTELVDECLKLVEPQDDVCICRNENDKSLINMP